MDFIVDAVYSAANSSEGKTLLFGTALGFGKIKYQEAILYCLYMMSDGDISSNEEKLFAGICSDLEIDDAVRDAIVSECTKRLSGKKSALTVIQENELESINALDLEFSNFNLNPETGKDSGTMLSSVKNEDTSNLALNQEKSHKMRIIWNLVNLGYADKTYSSHEKKIVKYLVETWEISPDVHKEMIDTAETMLALTNEKQRINDSMPKGKERAQKLRTLTIEIKKLVADITLTIQEMSL